MPYTDQQIEMLKAADKESATALFDKMNDQERSDLMNAVTDYDKRKAAPPPELQPWQKNLKPYTLSNGSKTLVRSDNAAYIDPSQNGQQRGVESPGWYQWDQNGKTWQKTTDAPAPETLGHRIMDMPLSPAGFISRAISDKIPNPTLANIAQGFGNAAHSTVQAALGGGQGASLPTSDPLVAQYIQEMDPTKRAILKDQIQAKMAQKAQEQGRQVNRFNQNRQATYESQYTPDIAGEMIGGAILQAPMAYVMPGAKAEGTLANWADRMLTNSANAAVSTTAMTPGTLTERLKAGGKAAAVAPVLQGAMELPGALKKNNPLAGLMGSKAERQAILDNAQAIREATKTKANPAGVEPSLAQAAQNPNLEKLEKITEWSPLSGKAKDLKSQNVGLSQVTKELAEGSSPALGMGGVGPTVSESAERALAARKAAIAPQYNFVRASVGDTPAVNTNRLAAYDKAISDASGVFGEDSSTVQSLKAAKAQIESGKVGNTFSDLEKIQDVHQSEAAAGAMSQNKADRILSRYDREIARATGEDMHATVAKADPTGFLSDVYKNANERFQKEVFPYDPAHKGDWQNKGQLQANRMLFGQEGFEDKGIKGMLKQNDPEMAKHAAEVLDQPGRDAIKAQIFKNIDDAFNDSKIGSPAKAADAIRKHSAFINEFMTPEEQTHLKGIEHAMETMKRSGQYLAQMENGQMVIAGGRVTALGPALALAAQSHPAPLIAEGAGMALSKLYTKLSDSPAGKEWLLGMSKAKPASVRANAMIDNLSKILAIKAGQSTKKQEQP